MINIFPLSSSLEFLPNAYNQKAYLLLAHFSILISTLALKNANAISKPFLAFYDLKCVASKDAKHNYCKKFYNSATVQFYL